MNKINIIPKKEKDSIIRSIEDLKSKKAKELAKKYKINMTEIPTMYYELHQKMSSKKRTPINLGDPSVPLNAGIELIKKFVATAIVYYELTEREIVRFMTNKKQSLTGIEERIIPTTINIHQKFERTEPISFYEEFGQLCEKYIQVINHQYQEALKKLEQGVE